MNPTATERRYLDQLLAAMRGPCDENFSGGETLSEEFAREFRTTLLIHHYFLKAPLATSSFEAAFLRAAQMAGYAVTPAPDGYRFWDIDLDGRKISLKTSSALNLRPGSLHISKLCEAAWIQDMRGAAQREEATKRLFSEYTDSVDSIIQFRFFRNISFYEMVQIPTSLLRQVEHVPRIAFAPDGPTIGIPVGQNPPDFKLKLDRSDAKITLSNINKQACVVLGSWQLEALDEVGKAALNN